MQKSASGTKKARSVVDRSVWTLITNKKQFIYVPRCSCCGTFKEDLYKHWFFTGMYCRPCIQYVLYCDYRTIEDMER